MNRIWIWHLWQDWRKARAEKRRQQRFNEGRMFALEYLRSCSDGHNELGHYVDTARVFGSYDDFDRGIEAALAEDESLALDHLPSS